MIHKESFLGRNPSHFQVNPFVKAYIISESLMWSAWNFVLPIFAIFVVREIAGSTVETAAVGYSIFLLSRVGAELLSGRILVNTTDRKKVGAVVMGMSLIGISYIGFVFTRSMYPLFFFYALTGMGIGLNAPAKNALFAIHLDKNKEATEWSVSDAFQFFSMALATAIGGFIALKFGFRPLFLLAFLVNMVAILPYLLFLLRLRKIGKSTQ